MKTFRVINTKSNDLIGDYPAEDEQGAILAVVRDAGYPSIADMEEATQTPCRLEASLVQTTNAVLLTDDGREAGRAVNIPWDEMHELDDRGCRYMTYDTPEELEAVLSGCREAEERAVKKQNHAIDHAYCVPTLHLSVLERVYRADSNLPMSAVMVLLSVARLHLLRAHPSVPELAAKLRMAPQVAGRAVRRLSTGMPKDKFGVAYELVRLIDGPKPPRGRPAKLVKLTEAGVYLLEDFLLEYQAKVESYLKHR